MSVASEVAGTDEASTPEQWRAGFDSVLNADSNNWQRARPPSGGAGAHTAMPLRRASGNSHAWGMRG